MCQEAWKQKITAAVQSSHIHLFTFTKVY